MGKYSSFLDLQQDRSEVGFTESVKEFLGITFQLPIVATCSFACLLVLLLSFLSHSASLTVLSGITSQINYKHSNPHLRTTFRRNISQDTMSVMNKNRKKTMFFECLLYT